MIISKKCSFFMNLLFILFILIVSFPIAINASSYEPNVDRPGSDYMNFDLSFPDYHLCMDACENDPKCKAFTYVKPGVQGQAARCWLKGAVPAPRVSDCCISGVKGRVNQTDSNYSPTQTSIQTRALTGSTAAHEKSINNPQKPAAMPDPLPKPAAMPDPLPKPTYETFSKEGTLVQRTSDFQPGIDLPGKDYKSFSLKTPDPNLCRKACLEDPQCRAFTYVKPGMQGPLARCWLKSSIPAARKNTGCISGIIDRNQSPTPTPSIERVQAPSAKGKMAQNNVDLPGMDYKNFDLPHADPRLCEEACLNDERCKAYTYVKPGVQGPKARCWLKHGVPQAKSNNCCISGVKKNNISEKDIALSRKQRMKNLENEILLRMQQKTNDINREFFKVQISNFAKNESNLKSRFDNRLGLHHTITQSWEKAFNESKKLFYSKSIPLGPPKITKLESDPPASDPYAYAATVVLGGRMAIRGENFGHDPGDNGGVYIQYDKPTEEFEEREKLYLTLEPLTGSWSNSWSNNVILVKLPETIPQLTGSRGNLLLYQGTSSNFAVAEIWFQGGKSDRPAVQTIKTAPMNDSATLGGTILIEGYNFGRSGKVFLHSSLGRMELVGAGTSGTWVDSWKDNAIFAHIPEIVKNPPNYVPQKADLEIYDNNGELFYKMPINFGPKMFYSVYSGINFLSLDKGDPKDSAKENNVSQSAKYDGPMLIVSHDPGCGWSGNHGQDNFFYKKPLPPNCKVVDFAFAYIHPDDEEWEFFKWGLGVMKSWLECLGTANMGSCFDLVTDFFPIIFGGSNAGQHYARPVKMPSLSDPSTTVVWDNSCTGPWEGVPVLYAIQFLLYGPENVVPR